MERDIELAVHHAVDLARARGGTLACITLRGSGAAASVVTAVASTAFARLGVGCEEIRFEDGTGPVRLASVELHRGG